MIQASQLCKTYETLRVLDCMDLQIPKGCIFGLAGRSGAGKSTLLRCINGLDPYTGGSLQVDGVEVRDLKKKDLRVFRKQIGMIFQQFSLLERLTVYENVALPLKCWKTPTPVIRSRVKELLDLVGLGEKADQKPRALSGGQKQRVAIARALSLEPHILLSDEAASALDPNTTREILGLLQQINRTMGITIIMVTHQMPVLSSVCQEVAILEKGQIAVKGSAAEIFNHPSDALKNLLGDAGGDRLPFRAPVGLVIDCDMKNLGRMAADLKIDVTISGALIPDTGVMVQVSTADLTAIRDYLDRRSFSWQFRGNEKNVSEDPAVLYQGECA